MKRILFLLGILICLVVIIGFVYVMNRISVPASSSSETLTFTIVKGQGVKEIASTLKEAGLITDRNIFYFYIFVSRDDKKLQAGEYLLARNLNMIELVNKLVKGEVGLNERLITVIEGWNTREIAEYLEKQGLFTQDEFLLAGQTTDTRTILPDQTYDFLKDKPADQGLEGYLFPDTYLVFRDASADEVVGKMLDNFDQKFTSEIRAKIASQGKTIYETVTLASIVEKEVRIAEDRKIAAGIFLNRLAMGKPLESDATVNYITGKSLLQPTYEDIGVDSPYNTYKYAGLPPSPICNPSLESIQSVIEPTDSDYLYFLTKPDGSTVFSKTYEEHLANKEKYLK